MTGVYYTGAGIVRSPTIGNRSVGRIPMDG